MVTWLLSHHATARIAVSAWRWCRLKPISLQQATWAGVSGSCSALEQAMQSRQAQARVSLAAAIAPLQQVQGLLPGDGTRQSLLFRGLQVRQVHDQISRALAGEEATRLGGTESCGHGSVDAFVPVARCLPQVGDSLALGIGADHCFEA